MKRLAGLFVLGLVSGAAVGCGGNSSPSSTVSNGGVGGVGGGGAPAGGAAPSGGAGGAMAGSGGSGGVVDTGPPEWLAYSAPDGTYVYDASTFPQLTPIKLAPPPGGDYVSGEAPRWSPDGSRLMYISGSSLLLWDMTGAMPSAPITLATNITPSEDVQTISWSPDGKSVMLLDGHVLSVLDPSGPMPEKHQISTTDQYYQWAPAGGGVVIDDADGVGVITVNAGVPTAIQHLDSSNAGWTWSPDGKYVGTDNQTAVMLFDVSVTPPKATNVYPLTRTYASSPDFNSDGSLLSFNDGDGTGALHFVSVTAPETVIDLKAPDGTPGGGGAWVPAHPTWIVFNTTPTSTTAMSPWFLADVSATPIVPKPLMLPDNGTIAQWMPGGTGVLAFNSTDTQLSLIDLSAAAAQPVQFPVETSAIYQYQLSPDQKSLAYCTQQNLRIAPFSDPATRKTLTVIQNDKDDFFFDWSPSGRFIALRLNTDDFKSSSIEIVRADGALFSLTGTLLPTVGTNLIGSAWRPVKQ